MTDEEQKKVFSRNLVKHLNLSGHNQSEVAKAIKVSPQTFNTWMRAKAIPRMDKIELLANYFHINKSDLIDEKENSNPALERIAQSLECLHDFDNPYEREFLVEQITNNITNTIQFYKNAKKLQKK